MYRSLPETKRKEIFIVSVEFRHILQFESALNSAMPSRLFPGVLEKDMSNKRLQIMQYLAYFVVQHFVDLHNNFDSFGLALACHDFLRSNTHSENPSPLISIPGYPNLNEGTTEAIKSFCMSLYFGLFSEMKKHNLKKIEFVRFDRLGLCLKAIQ